MEVQLVHYDQLCQSPEGSHLLVVVAHNELLEIYP
jgi:hypothetical protein